MYDIAIIGAGWAGYRAALEAKRLGLSPCLIEKDELGGTCLNRGCIPTKILVNSSHQLAQIKDCAKFGIAAEPPKINLQNLLARKIEVVEALRKAMDSVLRAQGIEFIKGNAKLVNENTLQIDSQKIEARFILVATGSLPQELPFLKFDHKIIISSDDALNLETLPKSILIVGGGVIGCEFAGIYSSLGAKVTIVEILEQIIPTEDRETAKKLEASFKKRGIEIFTNTDVRTFDLNRFDKVLVSCGRAPNTKNLGLEEIGVKKDGQKILVNEYLQTNIPNIYAVGDCIGGYQLAHVASFEGIVATKNIAGQKIKLDLRAVPNCIFTHPEISSVGLSEDKAKDAGIKIKIAKFSFLANGMARILDETEGFIKIIIDEATDDILGATIFGAKATELISVLTVAVQNKLKSMQIRQTIFAHPTLSEGIWEAVSSNEY